MQTVEERLAYIEGRVQEHSRAMDDFRDAVSRLERRIDALDVKLDARLHDLDQKLTRTFLWMVGMQVTVLAAVVGVLVQLAL